MGALLPKCGNFVYIRLYSTYITNLLFFCGIFYTFALLSDI